MSFFPYCGVLVYPSYGALGVMAVFAAAVLATIEYFVITDRIGRGFRKLLSRACSMYEPYFRNVIERYWKVSYSVLQRLFTGTPFKPAITRMLGARIGKKMFDDGMDLTEATLVEMGDYCTVSDATILQSHSLEEGVFKSDRIRIGKGCTIGCHAFVHYGKGRNSPGCQQGGRNIMALSLSIELLYNLKDKY